MNPYERFLRQIDILNPEKCKEPIFIIGAGATGSFTALTLAKMGLTDIRIFDGDTIEEHNFPNQMYPLRTLGINKTEALKSVVEEFTGTEIKTIPRMYKSEPLRGIVISALDTMKGRKQIYKNACKGNVKLLLDPRAGPELFRLLTVDLSLETEKKWYEENLYSDEEALEAPCTARSIIYSMLLISAYVCRQVKLYLMNEEYKRDIYVDMKNNLLWVS